jgi:hypothetical protein
VKPSYNLEWQNSQCEDTITISKSYFEHLLNCLANQKFIDELSIDMQKENQGVIDRAWQEGMFIMSLDVQIKDTYKQMVEKYVEVWNKAIPFIKECISDDSKKYPNDVNVDFKWTELVPQEIEMWMRLCCYPDAVVDCEKEKYMPGMVSLGDFNEISNRRGFTPTMRNFLIDILKDIGIGEQLKKEPVEEVEEILGEQFKKEPIGEVKEILEKKGKIE